MKNTVGSARTLLLAALAVAAAGMVAAIVFVSVRSGDPADPSAPGDERYAPLGGGPGDPGRRRARPAGEASAEDDDDGDDEGDEYTGDIFLPGEVQGDRTADGPEFWITPDTLRAVMKARHWEEIRRMIDVLQRDGKTVPEDVVDELVAMLGKDDTRLDAVLALGGVTDDRSGKLLVDLALSKDAELGARTAALDALEKSGQKTAMPRLQELIAAEGAVDEEILRHAYRAVAGIGGPDAAVTLLDLLSRHRDDDLTNAVVVALGKAKGIDEALALGAREARDKGDKAYLENAFKAAFFQGTANGPEMKGELLRTVEGASALSAFTEEHDQLTVQASAMPAAAAAGLVQPVLRVATTSGPLRDIALNSLRYARGDDGARAMAAAIQASNDDVVRRELAVAIGESGSRAATGTLVSLLSDRSENTRRAAARALGLVRDPASVKPILTALAKAAPDYDFGNSLVVALGTIGAREALAPLKTFLASDDAYWAQLRPFIRNAIARIETGNPESLRLAPENTAEAAK